LQIWIAAEKAVVMSVQQVVLQHILSSAPVLPAPTLHLAIITDGNGRWATSRGLPRSAGHRAGAEAARGAIEARAAVGNSHTDVVCPFVGELETAAPEVNAILRLLHEYLLTETTHCLEEGVRLSVIGGAIGFRRLFGKRLPMRKP